MLRMSRVGAVARAWRHMRMGLSVVATGILVAACTTQLGGGSTTPVGEPAAGTPAADGEVRIGLVLPLTAQGNAGLAGQSMKNAAGACVATRSGGSSTCGASVARPGFRSVTAISRRIYFAPSGSGRELLCLR